MLITSEQEMVSLGEKILGESLKKGSDKKPLIFWLQGELGAGKTYFTKGIGRALGIKNITSPTFVIIKKFKIPQKVSDNIEKKYLFHIDCYRVQGAQDAKQIDLEEVLTNPEAIVVIEWAERIAELIKKPYWRVKFEYIEEGRRKVLIDRQK